VARIAAESVERVREAVDFVEVVSPHTDLRRAGPQRYEGRCPFHEERTPSFGIDPVKKLYHCFGCGVGGDVFGFLREIEGLDFPTAVQQLADRYGIALEHESEDPGAARRRHERDRLYALLERTAAFYVRVLWESREAQGARAYLAERGLAETTLRQFRVGYAPSAHDTVLLASRRAGFTEAELRATGLAQRSQQGGGLYDRFRGRVMFPLADTRGRVLGFGARSLRENQRPKYLNSSDGAVYHKGRQLFGVDVARPQATRAGRVVVAEGYTDVLALHQAGLSHAVGLMGTAMTEEQVVELARLATIVLLCLDADAAGQEAMLRAARLAGARRLDLRVVPLPPGSDPADIVARDGAPAMEALLERAVPFARFEVQRALDRGELGSAEGRDRVLGEVRAVLGGLGPSALQQELVRLVAGRLELSEALVASLAAGGGRGPEGGGRELVRALDGREASERTFLAFCLALPDHGERALERIDLERLLSSALARRGAHYLRKHIHDPGAALPAEDPELASLIAELTLRAHAHPVKPDMLELQALQLELASLDRDIAAAGREGAGEVDGLARERQDVRQRISARMGG